MSESFTFKMALNTVHATVDAEGIEYKIGIAKQRVAFADMRHLYVIPGSVEQLVVSHDKGGKLKRLTIGANADQPAFGALIEALVAARPEIDIRHLPAKEANALLGRSRLLIGVAAALTIVVILAVMTWVSGAVEGWLD